MNNLTHINPFKYHMYNIIFFFVNAVFIRIIYHHGLLGEITDDLDEIIKWFFIENIFNPIDILFVIIAVFVLLRAYKNKEYSIIEMKPFRIIFITILIIGAVLLCFLYPIRNEGGSSLTALLLMGYLPMLFNYCYVEWANKLKKEAVSH